MLVKLVGTFLAAVLLFACGGSEDASGPRARNSPSPDSSASLEDSPSPQDSPDFSGVAVEVEIEDGTVRGVDEVVNAHVGDEVRIKATSDVDEELHVHGYDETADLAAGKPTVLRFTAEIPGAFEVELEEAGTPLFELRVQ